jgi:cytochrome P450
MSLAALRVDEHSLMDPRVQADPYAYYTALREQAPVYRMPDTGAYVVSRYRDIQFVLAHPEIWSIDLLGKAGFSMFQHAAAREVLEKHGFARNTKLSTDPPEHRAYRSLVDVSFTAGRVKASAPFVQRVVDELCDELLRERECEFVSRFASPLPIRVICDRLGLPASDVARIKRWSDAWIEPLSSACSEAREVEVAWLGVELQRYLSEKFEEKRRAPAEDILSDLANARLPDGSPLPDADRMGLAEHILVGGHETVTSALASGVWLLAQQPEVVDALRAEPALIRNFTEEVLRLESPSQGFFRYALADAELRGVFIPKGSMVHLRFAAANRDPEQFPNPDALDLHRSNAGAHLAFSQGEHHCLGAPLARLELTTAFRAIAQRFDRLRLAPDAQIRHTPGLALRSLVELRVAYEPRRGSSTDI